jgi:ectoine hydroxylase-related dioxygenase (phytanoyl-CoA dioxygenase family)
MYSSYSPPMKTHIVQYDTTAFPFQELVGEALKVSDLADLPSEDPLYKRENDQSSQWHKRFYANNSGFLETYDRFIAQIIKPLFWYENEIVYQTVPTFRAHLRNNVSVGEFHRDRDYSHSPCEINFHLPFTDTNEMNSIWLESKEGLEDFKPQIVKYGQILVFDGANLKHGNKVNTSSSTRVSVDFRVIPGSLYEESGKQTVSAGVQMKIGGYFSII